ncbi:hypothetical protein BGZ50_008099 [Haplosporangium sp. Z 11]|nr:hypothetical protein BGZ50_008099 [Haplosporangium sp. Z 11]
MSRSMDGILLFEGFAARPSPTTVLKKVSFAMSAECGMEREQIETKLREKLLPLSSENEGSELNIEKDILSMHMAK